MMFYDKSRQAVVDSAKKVVGFIVDGRFTQQTRNDSCDPSYANGLAPMELEQISELMQKISLNSRSRTG